MPDLRDLPADPCPVCVHPLDDGRCPTCGKQPKLVVRVGEG